MFGLAVLTISTSGHQGNREDTSGQAIKDHLEGETFQVLRSDIVPDDKDTIAARLAEWALLFDQGRGLPAPTRTKPV